MHSTYSITLLKSIRANFTFLSRSEKLIQAKTHFLSHFVGSSPSWGDIFFFWNLGFFVHFNTLEIRVINLRGQNSLKIQKFTQKNSKIAIAIYLCNIWLNNKIYKEILWLSICQGAMVYRLAQSPSDQKVAGSNPGLAMSFSIFFYPKWDKKWVFAWISFSECTTRIILGLSSFRT